MNDRCLLDERMIQSALLREATEKLNTVWRLAYAYRPPELLHWLEALTGELDLRREFVRSALEARKPGAVA